jgi:hypothetical protein
MVKPKCQEIGGAQLIMVVEVPWPHLSPFFLFYRYELRLPIHIFYHTSFFFPFFLLIDARKERG